MFDHLSIKWKINMIDRLIDSSPRSQYKNYEQNISKFTYPTKSLFCNGGRVIAGFYRIKNDIHYSTIPSPQRLTFL